MNATPDAAQRYAGAVRHVLVHAHIFKNAGTTFDWSLARSFGSGFVDHRADDDLVKGKMDYLEDYLRQNPAVTAFSSHRIAFPVENRPGFRFHTVHLLRHPIARIRSVYEFERRDTVSQEPGAHMAKRMSLPDFVAWYLAPGSPATIRSGQTIFCARQGFGETRDALERALELIGESRLIGVVEMYDESMVLFEYYLQRYFPSLDLASAKQNATKYESDAVLNDPVQSVLDEIGALAPRLLDKNRADLQLYDQAKQSLLRRIAEVPLFDRRLNRFKERCAALRAPAR